MIKIVHAMLDVNAKNDWWDDMPEDSRKTINKSLKDLDEGKGISHEKVKKCILDGSQNNLSATLTSPFHSLYLLQF